MLVINTMLAISTVPSGKSSTARIGSRRLLPAMHRRTPGGRRLAPLAASPDRRGEPAEVPNQLGGYPGSGAGRLASSNRAKLAGNCRCSGSRSAALGACSRVVYSKRKPFTGSSKKNER